MDLAGIMVLRVHGIPQIQTWQTEVEDSGPVYLLSKGLGIPVLLNYSAIQSIWRKAKRRISGASCGRRFPQRGNGSIPVFRKKDFVAAYAAVLGRSGWM